MASSRIETVGHAAFAVCYVCKEESLSTLYKGGYKARIVPVSDGERRARP